MLFMMAVFKYKQKYMILKFYKKLGFGMVTDLNQNSGFGCTPYMGCICKVK